MTPSEQLSLWVTRDPKRPAIITAEGSLTYEDLYDKAMALAAVFSAKKTANGPQVTPILVDNSLDSMLVSISAIIGGASFALLSSAVDSTTQQEILTTLNSQLPVIVPDGVPTDSLPPGQERRGVSEILSSDRSRRHPPGEPGFIVFFSSGTTGSPKGVVSTWSRTLARAQARQGVHPRGQGSETILSFSPIHFPFGFNHLINVFLGSTVCFVDLQSTSLTNVLNLARESNVTRAYLIPGTARLIGRHVRATGAHLASLNSIEVTGEALRWEDLRDVRNLGRLDTRFVLGISATESALYFWCGFDAKNLPLSGPAPLGYPANGDVQLILHATLSDDTAVSEVLTSSLLAQSYWNDEKLDGERFLVDATGKRWWKSGDLVTKGNDGLYYHAGRVDDMVKIRGHQVHLGQVEERLLALEGVGQAVALVSQDNSLEAHLVPELNKSLDPEGIRRQIGPLLPAHMHPRTIIIHQKLPLTERGKVDRKALRQSTVAAEEMS
jgi:acyl-coenzyme A synthetase/AMP-(fatty) acid ligase